MSSARIQRALSQPIYLINISSTFGPSGITECDIHVKGTSGSDYIVSLISDDDTITCSCLDYQRRRQHCKHIYFVLVRYLQITDDAMLESNISKSAICDIASRIFEKAIFQNNTNTQLWVAEKVKPRDIDEECPICFDDMSGDGDYIRCQYSCGRRVHAACYKMWNTNKNTCVYCRANLSAP